MIKFTANFNSFPTSIHPISMAYSNVNGIMCTLPLFLSIFKHWFRQTEQQPLAHLQMMKVRRLKFVFHLTIYFLIHFHIHFHICFVFVFSAGFRGQMYFMMKIGPHCPYQNHSCSMLRQPYTQWCPKKIYPNYYTLEQFSPSVVICQTTESLRPSSFSQKHSQKNVCPNFKINTPRHNDTTLIFPYRRKNMQ